jgi:hypothetical protein
MPECEPPFLNRVCQVLQDLEVAEVPEKAVGVEVGSRKLDNHNVIVPMEPGTLVISGQVAQLMRRREMELLGDPVHQRTSSTE